MSQITSCPYSTAEMEKPRPEQYETHLAMVMSAAVVDAPVKALPATSWIPPFKVHPEGTANEAAADEAVEAADEVALATADEADEAAEEAGPMTTVRQSGPPQIEPSLAPGQGMLH
jgi:hypothetical protein